MNTIYRVMSLAICREVNKNWFVWFNNSPAAQTALQASLTKIFWVCTLMFAIVLHFYGISLVQPLIGANQPLPNVDSNRPISMSAMDTMGTRIPIPLAVYGALLS